MTVISKKTFISKARTAIDDIAPVGFSDTFGADTDGELWQAAKRAVEELSLELPLELLDATVFTQSGTYDSSLGCNYTRLPQDFLRFASLSIEGCPGMLHELMDPGSDGEKMQRSVWSRGSVSKPKAMIHFDAAGKKSISWWPGGLSHNLATVAYIAKHSVTGDASAPAFELDDETGNSVAAEAPYIDCALRSESVMLAVYRAASLFFEGKKEGDLAEKFRNLSTHY